jgi:hypothetical protein
MKRRDPDTADLFSEFAPRPVVERYSPERIRGANPAQVIKRAVSEAIRESGQPRSELAAAMSEYLGERVTATMLDQYTSTANEGANIPAHRLIALLVVTGDIRLINAALADAGVIAVAGNFEALIFREMAKDARARLDREIAAADLQWRTGR